MNKVKLVGTLSSYIGGYCHACQPAYNSYCHANLIKPLPYIPWHDRDDAWCPTMVRLIQFLQSYIWLISFIGIYHIRRAGRPGKPCIACIQLPRFLFWHENRCNNINSHPGPFRFISVYVLCPTRFSNLPLLPCYSVDAELKFTHAHQLGKDRPGHHRPKNAAKITLTYMVR